jgi:hypothetical protein
MLVEMGRLDAGSLDRLLEDYHAVQPREPGNPVENGRKAAVVKRKSGKPARKAPARGKTGTAI